MTKKFNLFLTIITVALFGLQLTAFSQAYQGYTLFAGNNSKNTYLINMNNTTYHSWTHTRNGGYSCYLMTDGTLWRSAVASTTYFNGGGATGVIQKIAWNGTVLWEFTYATSSYRSHHDFSVLPNGNVLLIAWESKTAAQCIAAGLNHSATLWPDHIVEVQPVGTNGGNIVWKWHFWDHLIQDWDSTKANYGVVANHPELLDINVGSTSGDWMHCNGISYDTLTDQIVISSHNLNEVFVIDHSTTIQEAAGHTGGRWGKGGDFLYRWGKPANYRAPGTTVFNVVHCSVWIPYDCPGAGNIMAFNNRSGTNSSIVMEIVPPRDSLGNFIHVPGTAYGPASATWTYSASGFYSQHLGGNQRLPNGNTVICESTVGYMFEVNPAGVTQWYYNRGGEVVRALRYPTNYITSIENNLGIPATIPTTTELTSAYPNPFNPVINIKYSLAKQSNVTVKIFNILGQEIKTLVNENSQAAGNYDIQWNGITESGLYAPSGVYFCRLQTPDITQTRKIVFAK